MGGYSRVSIGLFPLFVHCAIQRLERYFLGSSWNLRRPMVDYDCDAKGDETQCIAYSACSP